VDLVRVCLKKDREIDVNRVDNIRWTVSEPIDYAINELVVACQISSLMCYRWSERRYRVSIYPLLSSHPIIRGFLTGMVSE